MAHVGAVVGVPMMDADAIELEDMGTCPHVLLIARRMEHHRHASPWLRISWGRFRARYTWRCIILGRPRVVLPIRGAGNRT